MSTLGIRIKEIRKTAGLSQEKLAVLAGVKTKSAVSSWEKDATQPNAEQLVIIAKLGNKTTDWLLTGTDSILSTKSHSDLTSDNTENIKQLIPVVESVPTGEPEISENSEEYKAEGFDYNPALYRWINVDYQFSESVTPFIKPGDMILIGLEEQIYNGDLIAVRWGEDKGALRIVNFFPNESEKVNLSGYNPAVPQLAVNKNEISMYKVVLIKKKK